MDIVKALQLQKSGGISAKPHSGLAVRNAVCVPESWAPPEAAAAAAEKFPGKEFS